MYQLAIALLFWSTTVEYTAQPGQVSDMLTTKLSGTHICPPSAVMLSPSMAGVSACHDCHPQHARQHAAHQLHYVFRRQLSQRYVHCLSWCELSQRCVSSRPFRSNATQNSVIASTPVGSQCRQCKPPVNNMPACLDGDTPQVRVTDMCKRDQSVSCFWQVAAANE